MVYWQGMEASATTCSDNSAPIRTRRYWRWLLLALLLAALGAGWYYYPRTYRPVAYYGSYGLKWLCSKRGYILHEAPNVLAMYDWQGKRLWRVETIQPQPGKHLIDTATLYKRCYDFTCDDTGGRLAVITRQPDGITVQGWRDGREEYRTHFSGIMNDRRQRLYIRQLESGRLLIWSRQNDYSTAALIDRGKLLGTGQLPQTFVAMDEAKYLINRINDGFRYAHLRVHDGKLLVETMYTFAKPLTFEESAYGVTASAYDGGRVLTDDGTLYGPRGRIAPSSGWWHRSGESDGIYVLQSKGRQLRVWSPRTRRTAWQFHLKGEYVNGVSTMDGQHAFFCMKPDLNNKLGTLLRRLPWQSANAEKLGLDSFALYQRPGLLRAQARIDNEAWWHARGQASTECWFCPAPDGRSVIVSILGTTSTGKEATRMVLLRY